MKVMRKSIRTRIILICAVVCILTLSGGVFYLMKRQEAIYLDSVKEQAKLLFNQIILTRRWIADHGGIFVEKLPWVTPNPYLGNSMTRDIEGRIYVRENPAMVTRQLSEYARSRSAYWFHITSLRPVNSSNAPDDFEREALMAFEKEGRREMSGVRVMDGRKYFRYIAPLRMETSCLECHRQHGYRIGDIRGAISVTIPLDSIYADLRKERYILILIGAMVVMILLAGLSLALNRLIVVPIKRLRDFVTEWADTDRENRDIEPALCRTVKDPECGDRGDEIEDLYRSFCRLHDIINRQQSELHSRIADATRELSVMNEQLIRARDRYKQMSQRKSEFIASLSHELRTPLTSVKGAIGYIEKKLNDSAPEVSGDISTFLEIMERNINRVVKLVEDTLRIEKIEAGQLEFHLSCVDIANMLCDAYNEFLPLAVSKGLSLRLEVEEKLMAYTDGDRIRQVTDNLLQNALRYSPRGKEIIIEGERSGDLIIVRIIDHGPGIVPGEQKRIFDRFYRGAKGGTGLGLTISRGIIEGLGGDIGVESDGRQGSIFHFRIPAAGEISSADGARKEIRCAGHNDSG